jgi:hypothetical protein
MLSSTHQINLLIYLTKMSIKILKILPKGDESDERITFSVLEDCNLGDYLVADDTFANGAPSNRLRNVYFFPSIDVKKGERVSVRTKKGKYSVYQEAPTKPKWHRLYWGLDKPVWNDSGDCAHLIYAPRNKRSHFQAP